MQVRISCHFVPIFLIELDKFPELQYFLVVSLVKLNKAKVTRYLALCTTYTTQGQPHLALGIYII